MAGPAGGVAATRRGRGLAGSGGLRRVHERRPGSGGGLAARAAARTALSPRGTEQIIAGQSGGRGRWVTSYGLCVGQHDGMGPRGMSSSRSRPRQGWVGLAAITILAVVLTTAPVPTPQTKANRGALQDGVGGRDLPFDPRLAAVSCPVERGSVKTGSDSSRYRVSTTMTAATVAYLGSRPKPSSYPSNSHPVLYELKTWRLTATLTQYRIKSDGDIHAVIRDAAGHRMIAELPYPACVPASSRWKAAISKARTAFQSRFPASTSWRYVHRTVTLQGLGMFDVLHGQTGVAPNGFELHPVTGFTG